MTNVSDDRMAELMQKLDLYIAESVAHRQAMDSWTDMMEELTHQQFEFLTEHKKGLKKLTKMVVKNDIELRMLIGSISAIVVRSAPTTPTK